KLRQEVESGRVLSWLMEGVEMWKEEGLGPIPEAVELATQAHLRDCDIVGQWMSDEMEANAEDQVWAITAYQQYKQWCQLRGLKPLNVANFGKKLSQNGVKSGRSTGGRMIYDGWSLKEPDTPII